MKIVHIHTGVPGGASKACIAIHRALLAQGVDSKVLAKTGGEEVPFLFKVQRTNLNCWVPPTNKLVRKIKNKLRKRGIGLLPSEIYDRAIWDLWEKHKDVCFTASYSSYDLAENPYVKEADVVHLHWVQDFLDFDSFFRKMAEMNKPVVWTVRDLNPMMGGFHHFRIKAKYYEEYKMVEDAMYEIKKKALTSYPNLTLVALSSHMKEIIAQHEFFRGKPVYTVFNCVDALGFSVIDKKVARNAIGVNNDKKVALFVSSTLNDSEKGFSECVEALDSIGFEDLILVCVGDGEVPQTKHLSIRHFDSIGETSELCELYSAADVFVNSSFQESFGNTTIEALVCGTPVVMTPTGIAKDIINEANGMVCEDFSAESIAKAVKHVLSMQYNPTQIRETVIAKVRPEKIAKDYIIVYEEAMKRSNLEKEN